MITEIAGTVLESEKRFKCLMRCMLFNVFFNYTQLRIRRPCRHCLARKRFKRNLTKSILGDFSSTIDAFQFVFKVPTKMIKYYWSNYKFSVIGTAYLRLAF